MCNRQYQRRLERVYAFSFDSNVAGSARILPFFMVPSGCKFKIKKSAFDRPFPNISDPKPFKRNWDVFNRIEAAGHSGASHT